MEANLIVISGKHAGKEIPLGGKKCLIGQGEECQLRLPSTMVSRKHCLLRFDQFPATLEDCGSTNGTLLNGQPVAGRKELKDGDRLMVGEFEFEVRLAAVVGKKTRPIASLGADNVDIGDWLGPTDQIPATPPPAQPATAITAATTKRWPARASTTRPPCRCRSRKRKERPAGKAGGKPRVSVKPSTESSGEAAADMLRHFFHRNKP